MGFYPLHSTVLVQWNQAKSTRKYASEETKSAMARPVLNYFKTLFQYNNTPYIYNVTPKTNENVPFQATYHRNKKQRTGRHNTHLTSTLHYFCGIKIV
jgi:hypothetical protein